MNTAEVPWFGAAGPPLNGTDDLAGTHVPLLVRYWRVVLRRRWLIPPRLPH